MRRSGPRLQPPALGAADQTLGQIQRLQEGIVVGDQLQCCRVVTPLDVDSGCSWLMKRRSCVCPAMQ
ncbi:hypothetical protein AY586_09380 [Marichromatium gracile]|uniref:Uncharacterized protein n=1 Tax=Marichromatium gracile TaxID=1048 RepID=A0ABR5VIW0_MARGR|nr:hypothetical protein AY586_09380 [Marichromatium gracile]